MKRISIFLLLVLLFWYGTGLSRTGMDSAYCERLYYTCRVWGFLKYYSPQSKADWDDALIDLLDLGEIASTREAFNSAMESLLNLAEPARTNSVMFVRTESHAVPRLDWSWQSDSVFSETVSAGLMKIRSNFSPGENRYYHAILYQAPNFEGDNKYSAANVGLSEEMRLLSLFRYWNIVQYFYPYRDLLDQPWEQTLKEFIPKMISSNSDRSYYLTMLELRMHLDDSHASMGGDYINNEIFGTYRAPILLKNVEKRTVVFEVYQDPSEFRQGDIIKAINGVPVQVLRDSLRRIAYGANSSAIDKNINRYLIQGMNRSVDLTVENETGEKIVRTARTVPNNQYAELQETNWSRKKSVWHFINHGGYHFAYVDLRRLERNDIFQMVEDLWTSDGMVFDMRGYPKGTMGLLIQYLLWGSYANALFLFPDPAMPGRFYWQESIVTANAANVYQHPLCILVDENTISQAEYTVMTLQLYRDATVVGSQTAGSDGNVVTIYLPGGITTNITGLGVVYPDTTQTQRIGILPDVEAVPTIRGIREGRDEVLEKALEFLENKLGKIIEPSDSGSGGFTITVHPNPFRESTRISFRPERQENVTVKILNVCGRQMRMLKAAIGGNEIIWDGRDGEGREAASGIYIVCVQVGDALHVRKAVRIR